MSFAERTQNEIPERRHCSLSRVVEEEIVAVRLSQSPFERGFKVIRIKMADTRRRVKLYALNAERQWDDRGTGHVTSSFVDRLKGMSG